MLSLVSLAVLLTGVPRPQEPPTNAPGLLFESAIRPLAPSAMAGVLWYQGESNAHRPELAGRLFRMLVTDWRRAWSRPKLPFYFVQLPAMGRANWPEFRDVQAACLDLPETGMAVAIDVGHPTDVHPTDKRPVGERLARIALTKTYGRNIPFAGPTPSNVRREGRRLRIEFTHADGLAWTHGRGPVGFEVAGEEGRFHPATAEIDGHQVILSAPDVRAPVEARYAWAPVPEWSLINGAGLPAAPFRKRASPR